MPAELRHDRKWFSPSRKPGSIQLLLGVRHSQLTLRAVAREKSHGDSLGYSPPAPPGDRDICKEEHEKKKEIKDFQENKDEDNFSHLQQPSWVGWRSSSVQFTASSPQDTCSPLISSLSHSGLFFLLLKYYVGSFGQELFDPGTTFTPEYIARGRGADPSFSACLGSIIRLARLEWLKIN